jgi:hypothetical protein
VIVAIINQTAPVGLVRVEEFRASDSASEAVDAFVSEQSPPLPPGNYLGFDTGWSSYTPPGKGQVWAYDFDAAGLVAAEAGFDESLEQLKMSRYKAIDGRTGELIDLGYVYSGVPLSLSLEAQLRIEGMDRARNETYVVYPVEWNSLDDSTKAVLADATELHTMYMTALGTLRARVDSGTALKDQIRAATTRAEVEAVVDNR